jgi:hypothetical protein
MTSYLSDSVDTKTRRPYPVASGEYIYCDDLSHEAHAHRLVMIPTASSVTLQELSQFAYGCSLSKSSSSTRADSTCRGLACGAIFTRLGILPTSLALPTHIIITTGLDWTRLLFS